MHVVTSLHSNFRRHVSNETIRETESQTRKLFRYDKLNMQYDTARSNNDKVKVCGAHSPLAGDVHEILGAINYLAQRDRQTYRGIAALNYQ